MSEITSNDAGQAEGIEDRLRAMPQLDWIHSIFLIYSGAHNTINAWNRAENGLFFLFVVVGILSVELMLWSIYREWKNGRLVGPMLGVAKLAGIVALFYATAGILAEAQSAGEVSGWLLTYYNWILPSSAPVMFLFAFLIQSVDPLMTMERDTIAMQHSLQIETRRETLDGQRLQLKQQRTQRESEYALVSRQWDAIQRHIGSWRTGWRLNGRARKEVKQAVKGIESGFKVTGLLGQGGAGQDGAGLPSSGWQGNGTRAGKG